MTQSNSITHQHDLTIDIADAALVFRSVVIDDRTPTGAQIAAAAGFAPSQQATILLMLPSGSLEDVRPDEVVDLSARVGRFIVVESDASYRITIDGKRVDWPVQRVSGSVIRQLAGAPPEKAIYFEQQDQPDQMLEDSDVLDLSQTGVEAFYSRARVWVLNVQGVRLELHEPTITVQRAMEMAGFDVSQGWQIFLKVVGQPKKAMNLADVIDLRTPGIEKLRLTPADVNNGEVLSSRRQEFGILDVDEDFLNERFAHWEAVVEGGRRWLIIYAYPIPEGYNVRRATLALEVPAGYPGAQIDMFYVSPPLALKSQNLIPNTEGIQAILGCNFQRWSRHRGIGSPWRADSDNVITHLALVESSISKEVQ